MPGFEAPINLVYSQRNRSAAIRIPITGSNPKAKRIEFRLVYLSNSTVNWCPGLGTVLANEEVTAEGKSERGNFPVFRKNLSQWMMRITAYSDRLLDDLSKR